MNVLTFLAKNWDSVLVVVAFLAVVVVLIKRGETKILKQILFNLVTQAEKQFGSGTGSLKYAAVADWIYQRIPAVLKLLFTSSDIEKMIEAALEEAWKACLSASKNRPSRPNPQKTKHVRFGQKRKPVGGHSPAGFLFYSLRDKEDRNL